MDWEFDEDQLLTYNNPVFVEQCKRRNKDFDKLNTGWIVQKPLDEEEDVMAEPEDDDFEDDDFEEEDEEILFSSPRKKSSTDKSTESETKENKSPEPPKPIAPKEISSQDLDDLLDDLFGLDSSDSNTDSSSHEPLATTTPIKPKIKLNIDPNKSSKPKMKLNIKKPQ